MRRIGFLVLLMVSLFLPATGGAATLLPDQLDRGDLVPSELLTDCLQGYEVFDFVVARDYFGGSFGRRLFVWYDEGNPPVLNTDWQIPDFDHNYFENIQYFHRREYCSAVPEPRAALAFGLGAVLIAGALRRR